MLFLFLLYFEPVFFEATVLFNGVLEGEDVYIEYLHTLKLCIVNWLEVQIVYDVLILSLDEEFSDLHPGLNFLFL